jgi:cytochrome c
MLTKSKWFRAISELLCVAWQPSGLACAGLYDGSDIFTGAIMQHAIRRFTVAFVLVMSAIAPGMAQQRGTPEEAQALADRAVVHMRQVGPVAAIKDFNDPKGGYSDRDLFVIVYDPDGIIMTGIPALIGKNARALTDVTGKEFGKEIINAAYTKDGSWVEYHMTDPATKKVELKTSYIRKFDDYIVFVGAYKP